MVGTPPVSSQSPAGTSPAANSAQDPAQNVNPAERVILEYLQARGHTSAEKAFREELEAVSPDERRKEVETVAAKELVKTLAVYGENALKASAVFQELSTLGSSSSLQNLIASIGSVGADDILSIDPSDKHEGYREFEAWVDGSLDMYRVSFWFYTPC